MATKHTPTPWARGEPEGNDALATIRTADGETVIAEVYFVEGHGTREEAEGDLAHMLVATELADALHGLVKQITGGALVRDISHDNEPGWALKAMPLVMALKHADEALRAAGRIP